MSVPAGRPLIDVLSLAYRADRPVLLHGAHGVGKSEIVAEAARELGVECITLDLSVLEPPDLVGIPQVVDGRTRYAVPSFLPRAGAGVLMLEELNRAPAHVRSPCLQLLTARRLNDYALPRGWVPWAAVNDAADGYHVDDLDPALLARFIQMRVVPDVSEWRRWARGDGKLHEKVIRFVEGSPDVFGDPGANPRSWAYVSDVVKTWESAPARSLESLGACVSGLVGDRWAAAFLAAYESGNQPLTASIIVGKYPEWRGVIRQWLAAARLDLVAASLENLKRHLQPQREFRAVVEDNQKKGNVEAFLADLPADLKRQLREWLAERGLTGLRVPRRASA